MYQGGFAIGECLFWLLILTMIISLSSPTMLVLHPIHSFPTFKLYHTPLPIHTLSIPCSHVCVLNFTYIQHAPIHSIYRKVISPITVPPSLASPTESSSYIIPTSHYMLAAPGVSAMDPRIWPDATTWNPSRWTDEKGAGAEASELYTGGEQVDYGYGMVSKGTESPYQPFGAGRHRCVGEQFAYMQLSVIISYIVREFTLRLETPGREFPKTDYNVSQRFKIGDRVSLEAGERWTGEGRCHVACLIRPLIVFC